MHTGALVGYVERMQRGAIPHLQLPQRFSTDAVLSIDLATRRSLELNKTLSGETKGSLLHIIDRTVTGEHAVLSAL
jgi:DNA mismatch repair protein MutS